MPYFPENGGYARTVHSYNKHPAVKLSNIYWSKVGDFLEDNTIYTSDKNKTHMPTHCQLLFIAVYTRYIHVFSPGRFYTYIYTSEKSA